MKQGKEEFVQKEATLGREVAIVNKWATKPEVEILSLCVRGDVGGLTQARGHSHWRADVLQGMDFYIVP